MLHEIQKEFEEDRERRMFEQPFNSMWAEFGDGLQEAKRHIEKVTNLQHKEMLLVAFHLVYTCAWLAWGGFKIAMRARKQG